MKSVAISYCMHEDALEDGTYFLLSVEGLKEVKEQKKTGFAKLRFMNYFTYNKATSHLGDTEKHGKKQNSRWGNTNNSLPQTLPSPSQEGNEPQRLGMKPIQIN